MMNLGRACQRGPCTRLSGVWAGSIQAAPSSVGDSNVVCGRGARRAVSRAC